ncbi:hypothetical protein L210DRAFT_942160 [Boletus edulis BED1]|uniref:Uncharacterized protein n=1 Tax=Boletus edulis BED1 TaxID=1328754 RepID=A0AAD4G8U0_BOLED|nr:hypothetical protein L210DRAFT_942160 [Boletus edulis BED1]
MGELSTDAAAASAGVGPGLLTSGTAASAVFEFSPIWWFLELRNLEKVCRGGSVTLAVIRHG